MLFFVHPETLEARPYLPSLGRDMSHWHLVTAKNEDAAKARVIRNYSPAVAHPVAKPVPIKDSGRPWPDSPSELPSQATFVVEKLNKWLDSARKGAKVVAVPIDELSEVFAAADYVATILENGSNK